MNGRIFAQFGVVKLVGCIAALMRSTPSDAYEKVVSLVLVLKPREGKPVEDAEIRLPSVSR